MTARALNILFLMDFSTEAPRPENLKEALKDALWTDERRLVECLESMGHAVRILALWKDIQPLLNEIRTHNTDLVFNQCEAFHSSRNFESHVASVLELLGIPYTGASARNLEICKDKALTKKILNYHGIRTPQFLVSKQGEVGPGLSRLDKIPLPVIVKPLREEASEGIADASLVRTPQAAAERVDFLHRSLRSDVIIEEYIPGRELYLALLSEDQCLAVREFSFKKKESYEKKPLIASYRAKWNEEYRKKWGICNGPAHLSPELKAYIEKTGKSIYKALELNSFVRLDFRLSKSEELVFIEANPNPSLAYDDDFSQSAFASGMNFQTLIKYILQDALRRHRRNPFYELQAKI